MPNLCFPLLHTGRHIRYRSPLYLHCPRCHRLHRLRHLLLSSMPQPCHRLHHFHHRHHRRFHQSHQCSKRLRYICRSLCNQQHHAYLYHTYRPRLHNHPSRGWIKTRQHLSPLHLPILCRVRSTILALNDIRLPLHLYSNHCLCSHNRYPFKIEDSRWKKVDEDRRQAMRRYS